MSNQPALTFDKVNSNQVYTLEQDGDSVRLMMEFPMKDQSKSLYLLSDNAALDRISYSP